MVTMPNYHAHKIPPLRVDDDNSAWAMGDTHLYVYIDLCPHALAQRTYSTLLTASLEMHQSITTSITAQQNGTTTCPSRG